MRAVALKAPTEFQAGHRLPWKLRQLTTVWIRGEVLHRWRVYSGAKIVSQVRLFRSLGKSPRRPFSGIFKQGPNMGLYQGASVGALCCSWSSFGVSTDATALRTVRWREDGGSARQHRIPTPNLPCMRAQPWEAGGQLNTERCEFRAVGIRKVG